MPLPPTTDSHGPGFTHQTRDLSTREPSSWARALSVPQSQLHHPPFPFLATKITDRSPTNTPSSATYHQHSLHTSSYDKTRLRCAPVAVFIATLVGYHPSIQASKHPIALSKEAQRYLGTQGHYSHRNFVPLEIRLSKRHTRPHCLLTP